jgi:opacity protein-like surface antigen
VVVLRACLVVVLGAASAPAFAQAKPGGATPVEPKANVAAMYSFEHNFGANSPWGIAVDVSEKMQQLSPTLNWQAVMQFVYNHYNSGGSDFMFGGGARFGVTSHGNVTPYFQAIAGVTHCCEQNWFTLQMGGGADIKVSKTSRIKIRLEGNWVIIFDDPEHGFRLNAGVVIPFGKK